MEMVITVFVDPGLHHQFILISLHAHDSCGCVRDENNQSRCGMHWTSKRDPVLNVFV